jgi:hypothetical protein
MTDTDLIAGGLLILCTLAGLVYLYWKDST